MTSNKPCPECKGTGWYKVYNAYNPDDVQEVRCEYCPPKKEVPRLVLN